MNIVEIARDVPFPLSEHMIIACDSPLWKPCSRIRENWCTPFYVVSGFTCQDLSAVPHIRYVQIIYKRDHLSCSLL